MTKYINPYTDFGAAALANLTSQQRAIYEENLIQYWGMKSAIETAVETAIEEREMEIAKKGISKGLDNQTIAELTNLTPQKIDELRKEMKKKQ